MDWKGKTCINCVFCIDYECRRVPPTIGGIDDTTYPHVKHMPACAEYMEANDAGQKPVVRDLSALAGDVPFRDLESAIAGRVLEYALEKFPESLPGTPEQNMHLVFRLKTRFWEVIGDNDVANYIWNLPRPEFNNLVANSKD